MNSSSDYEDSIMNSNEDEDEGDEDFGNKSLNKKGGAKHQKGL
jgi:hypothetical protein